MRFAIIILLLVGCVSNEPAPWMMTFQPRIGTGYVADSSPTYPDGRRESVGCNLAYLYRAQPRLAFGIGLDSTVLRGAEDTDGNSIDYNSYGGALQSRFDSGHVAVTSYFAYYFGERQVDGDNGLDKVPLRGPGVGLAIAYRIPLGGEGVTSIDVGPYANFFSQRVGDDEGRIRNVSSGLMIGLTFGGPPVRDRSPPTPTTAPPTGPPPTGPPSTVPVR